MCLTLVGCDYEEDADDDSDGVGVLIVSDLGSSSIRTFTGVSALDSAVDIGLALSGSLTRLNRPGYLFVHPTTGELIVPDEGTGAVLFFDSPEEIEGNVPPDRVLFGPGTQLAGPIQVHVDSSTDELYVLDRANSQVLVYNDATNIDGEVAPERRIGGGATGILNPSAFFFRPSTEQMSVLNASEILTFESFRSANGQPAPSGRISGAATTFGNLSYAELTDSGTLVVIDSGAGQLLSFDNWAFDRSNEAPTRFMRGANTGLSGPTQFVILEDTIYIADGDEILVYDELSSLEGNPFPSRRFSAINPNSENLRGIVIP